MKKCGKCGKQGHYASTCGRESKASSKKKKKGKGSWLKAISTKLDSAMPEGEAETMGEPKAGDPFADLPPLPNIPQSAPVAEDATPAGSQSTSGGSTSDTPPTASGPSEKKQDEEAFVGTEELAEMLGGAAEWYVDTTGKFAGERGFMAFGGPFAKLANKSVQIIVKSNAAKLDIDPAEAAAWLCAGIMGTNSVQAYRAMKDEQRKEEEKKENERRAARAEAHRTNGVSPILPDAEPAREQHVPPGAIF